MLFLAVFLDFVAENIREGIVENHFMETKLGVMHVLQLECLFY